MPQTIGKVERKSLNAPEEVRTFEKGKVELVTIDGASIGRATFMPGWKWSAHVSPIAGTKSCMAAHFGYQLSGVLITCMDDGTQTKTRTGDVVVIPPGHDAWVEGNEPVVVIDWHGMTNYAKR